MGTERICKLVMTLESPLAHRRASLLLPPSLAFSGSPSTPGILETLPASRQQLPAAAASLTLSRRFLPQMPREARPVCSPEGRGMPGASGPRASAAGLHCESDVYSKAVFCLTSLTNRLRARAPFPRWVFFPAFCWPGSSGKSQCCLAHSSF